MKLYKKEDCKIIEGQIVCGDEIISLSPVVYKMINDLEIAVQKSMHLCLQPMVVKAPSLKGFKKKTNFSLPYVDKPETPWSDKQVEQAMGIMAEADAVAEAGEINELITEYAPLFDWVASEYVVDSGIPHEKIDTPVVGNILEVDTDCLINCLKIIQEAKSRWEETE